MERQFAERYAQLSQTHWWFRGRRKILSAVLDREGASGKILAVGCGPAEGLEWLRARGAVTGVDVDPVFAAGAAAGEFLHARAEALPFPSRSFDAVCAFDVIEHIDDDAAAIAEMARVACSRLVLTVPALPALWGPHDEINHHRRRYTKRTLRDAFARAQIPLAWCGYFNSLLLPPIAAVRWARRGRAPASDFDDPPPKVVSAVLEAILGLESPLVGRVGFPAGVSLVAVARI